MGSKGNTRAHAETAPVTGAILGNARFSAQNALTALTGTYNDALVWAYFNQKREALLLWHEHLDKKVLVGTLIQHMH